MMMIARSALIYSCIFLVFALLSTAQEQQEQGAAEHAVSRPRPRRMRSLYQACRKDIARLCPERRRVIKCIEANATLVEDTECKKWLDARSACVKDVEKSDCKGQLRICLMKSEKESLSEECRDSDFFRSLSRTHRIISSRRRRPENDPKNAAEAVSESK